MLAPSPSEKIPKRPPCISGGTQKQRAVPLCAETGSRFSANQPEAIAWGLSLFLFLQLISFRPQTLPAQCLKGPVGISRCTKAFGSQKELTFLSLLTCCRQFLPGRLTGIQFQMLDGRAGAPQNRTPGGAGPGNVHSCRSRAVSGTIKRRSRRRMQVAGRQDGRKESERSLEHVLCCHFSSRDLA